MLTDITTQRLRKLKKSRFLIIVIPLVYVICNYKSAFHFLAKLCQSGMYFLALGAKGRGHGLYKVQNPRPSASNTLHQALGSKLNTRMKVLLIA